MARCGARAAGGPRAGAPRPGLLRRVALALLLLLAWAPAAPAADLTPDEQKWVRALLDALGANSPATRRGAEAALVAFGPDALPEVVEAMPLKSETARKGLLRALRAMGAARVREALERQRENARGTPVRRIDELLADLGSALSPDLAVVVPLRPATDLAPDRVPLRAERAVRDRVPPPFAAAPLAVTVAPDALWLDADGDGTTETKVLAAEPRVVFLGPAPRSVPVLFQRKGDAWTACSASLLRGTRGKVVFELLDVDLDGRFDGEADERRVGDGAFGPHGGARRLGLDEGLATYEVARDGDATVLRLLGVRRPDGVSDDAWDGLAVLSAARLRLGLAAPGVDVARSRACEKHCAYLVENRAAPETAGLGAHEEQADRPGYSADGAAAGGSSVLSPIGDVADGVASFVPTMLHRDALLAPPSWAYGIGCARGARGWTAVWGAEVDVPPGAPLVVPAPGQTGVPPQGSAEHPEPDDPPGWYGRPRGYPVAAYLDRPLANPTLRLLDADGTSVAARTWGPGRPVNAARASRSARTVVLMPEAPLARGARYRAELSGTSDGAVVRWAWAFTTR